MKFPNSPRKMFPFAPGIPWRLRSHAYIVPEIDKRIWDECLRDRDFVIACFGGLLESFFSLSFCEAIVKSEPNRQMSWLGNPDFIPLVRSQRIARVSNLALNENDLLNYPTPIFMDADNNAYFNSLVNYITKKSYYPNPKLDVKNNEIVLKQIYKNCMLPWDNHVPRMRHLDFPSYENWKKTNKFYDTLKYIVVFPNTWKTSHNENHLEWNDRQIRELAEMVRHLGISVVSCGSDSFDIYYRAGNVYRAPMDLEIALCLISNAYGVMSADIDFLFLAMMISKASIISKPPSSIYDLYHNSEFIGAENDIFTDKDLNPKGVLGFLECLDI